MNRMKTYAWLVCLALAPLAHAKKAVLPDACGDNKVQFEVKAVDDHAQPLTPDAGKSLLVFVEENKVFGANATIRLGVDGAWVGATHGAQYFLVQLAPGEHHLCASMQNKIFGMGNQEHYVGVETINAEAGKVYYYGAVVGSEVTGVSGNSTSVNSTNTLTVQYSLLSEDEGKYRVKAGKLAQAKAK